MAEVLSFITCEYALVRGDRLDLFGVDTQFSADELYVVVEAEQVAAGASIQVVLVGPDGELEYGTEVELVPTHYPYFRSAFKIPISKRNRGFFAVELFVNGSRVAQRPVELRGGYGEEE